MWARCFFAGILAGLEPTAPDVKVAVDLRATVPKATPTDRRPEVDGYLSDANYTAGF